MRSSETVVVTTVVPVDPMAAFVLFTEDVDVWWRRGPRYRPAARDGGKMRFEPGVGGRLVETYGSKDDDAFEIGHILIWEPGTRLVFDWRAPEFAADEKTIVEVRFEPVREGTRVTLEHSGWDSIPLENRFRHGLSGGAFISMIGLRWGDQLTSLRAHARRN
jgi:uncharacterized protein YndB with AHSA1/START domain